MHYDGFAYAKENTQTILDKRTDEPVGQNKKISPQDFELLNKIYPSKEKCSETNQDDMELIKQSEEKEKTVQKANDAGKSWIQFLTSPIKWINKNNGPGRTNLFKAG